MRQVLLFLLLVCAVLAYQIWATPEWQLAIESAALDLARPIAIPLIHLINTPAFIYLLALLLLLGGVMAALQGFFTSLGLIFAFMGLVDALYFAPGGFRSGNLEEARGAIMQLLNASSFKFLTSVSALGSALLISIVHRYAQSRLRNAVYETVGLIESYLALWRQASPSMAARDGPADRRLDDLVSAVRGLTSRLDQLLASGK